MKGAKGGSRDRIISWLFSKKNQTIKEEEQNHQTKETKKLEEKKEKSKKTPKSKTILIKEEIINDKNKVVENEETASIEPTVIHQEIENISFIDNVETKEASLIDVALLLEIEKNVQQDYHQVNEIKYQLDVLNDSTSYEELTQIQYELDKIVKELIDIKNKYKDLNINLEDITIIQNTYIAPLLQEYKYKITNNITIDKSLKEIEDISTYTYIIDPLIKIEQDKKIIQEETNEKITTLVPRKEDFYELENQYLKTKGIDKQIDSYTNEINRLINDLDNKIKDSKEITSKINTTTYNIINSRKIINATLMLTAASFVPPTKIGNVFKIALLATATSMIASSFETKTRTTTTQITTYKDFEKEIRNGINNIDNVNNTISQAFLDIKDIKTIFEHTYMEHVDSIPEYKDFYNSVINLEKELIKQQHILEDYNKNMNDLLVENNIKVKKIEEEKF